MIIDDEPEKIPVRQSQFRLNGTVVFSAIISGFITLSLLIFWFVRGYTISILKQEIVKFEKSITETGYDFSYENLNFNRFSPFNILTINGLKIYSLDGKNYYEWHIPELKIGSALFSSQNLKLSFSPEQSFQKGLNIYHLSTPNLTTKLQFNDNGLKELNMTAKNFQITDVLSAEYFNVSVQKTDSEDGLKFNPFFESTINIKNIHIDSSVDQPLDKDIFRIYIHANVAGKIQTAETYRESIDEWLHSGGMIDIKRLIVNWNPLLMVARGDMYFNEKLEPNLHLMTSSKAFIETLDLLEKDNLLDRKGTFVVKILLNNKAFKLRKDDLYNTITTPINFNSGEVLIENIPIKKL